MSLKILILPTLIILSLILAIGYIKPDISSILAKQDEITAAEAALAQVDLVAGNISALSGAVSGQSEIVSFVSKYYPESLEEERVVDMLNFLAQQSGVIVTKIDVEENAVVRPAFENDPNIVLSEDGSIPPEVEAMLMAKVARSYSTDVAVLGAYPNIKDFFARVYHTDRLHSVNEVGIATREQSDSDQVAEEAEEGIQPNFLTGTLRADFPYVRQSSAGNALTNPIFQLSSFDFSAGEQAISFVTNPLPALEANTTGKPNPFE